MKRPTFTTPIQRARRGALAMALVAGFASAARAEAPPCAEDPALTEAALTLLLASRHAPSPEALLAETRREGSQAPHVRARTFRGDEDATPWLRAIAAAAEAPLACGLADDGARRLWLVGEQGGVIVPLGAPPTAVRVELAEGVRDAHLVVEDAEGRLVRLALPADGNPALLPSELTAPLVIQLLAAGPHGPRPMARALIGGDATDAPSSVSGGDLVASVRALRVAASASPLRHNELLSREAQAHAARVCEAGRAVHRPAAEGDPVARLRRRGLIARVVGETIARAASVADAIHSLADSPSHRMTLVDRRFTDAGFGVAADEHGGRCVVVLLAAWPRPVAR